MRAVTLAQATAPDTLAPSTDLLINEPLTFPPATAVPAADAGLVGMIHEFLALKAPRDAEFAALNKLSTRTPGLKARWNAWREAYSGVHELEKRIARTPAATPEGALLKAKLGAILLTGGDVEGADLAAEDGPGASRMWGMACAGIADLLRLKGMLSSQPAAGYPDAHPDAELLTYCTEASDADTRSAAIFDELDDVPGSDPRYEAGRAESQEIMVAYHKGVRRAAELRARTPEGLRAKASLALRSLGCQGTEDYPLVVSALREVAGRVGT